MERAEVLARLYLFSAERRAIEVLKVPNDESDADRLVREARQAELDANYLAWQMSPEPHVIDVADVDRFLVGFVWLVEQIRTMNADVMTDDEIMVPFYDAAKMVYGEERSAIRNFFRYAYILLFRSESGPRWSQFIRATGTDHLLRLIEERTSSFN